MINNILAILVDSLLFSCQKGEIDLYKRKNCLLLLKEYINRLTVDKFLHIPLILTLLDYNSRGQLGQYPCLEIQVPAVFGIDYVSANSINLTQNRYH